MKLKIAAALAAATFAAPAVAQDAAAGESAFRACIACHQITSPDGENIVGRGRTGPNLWGVIGRQAGVQADFNRYGDDLVAAGEAGLVWDEASLASYLEDPKGFLESYLDKDNARSMMAYRQPRGAEDIAAYLAQFGAEG